MNIVNGIYSPFLDEQKVEYSLAKDERKPNENMAVEVTGPNGAPTVRPPKTFFDKMAAYKKAKEPVSPKSDS
jgi:hypothetical protein